MSFLLLLIVSIAAAAEDFANSTTKFVPRIYQPIAKTEPGNIIFSPFSAHLVLSLLQSGSKGETLRQLRTNLYLPNDERKIEEGAYSLLSDLTCNSCHIFNLANKIYVQNNFTIKKKFERVATEVFGAESQSLDFTKSELASEQINKWVERQTNNTIKNLVSPDDVGAGTAMVLVNALHFKAKWSLPFDTRNTQREDFYKSSSEVVKVEMMHLRRKFFNYFESSSMRAKFLELTFEEGASMTIGLPDEINAVRSFEQETLEHFISSPPFKKTYLNVGLPKFKFEFRTDLKTVLQKIGITKIFSRSEADLSGIAGAKGDLTVSKIVQKAFVDLNEGGVEAAAATFAGVTFSSIQGAPKDFIVNRPFIFLIKIQNVIVFIGRVSDPKY